MLKPPMKCVECGRANCPNCDHKQVSRVASSVPIQDMSLGPNRGRTVGSQPHLECRCACCGDVWIYYMPMGAKFEDFAPLS